MAMTKAEELAIVQREYAELEDIYYRLDAFQENDDIEEILQRILPAIDVRKKYVTYLQSTMVVTDPGEFSHLWVEPQDRRN